MESSFAATLLVLAWTPAPRRASARTWRIQPVWWRASHPEQDEASLATAFLAPARTSGGALEQWRG